MRRVPGWLWAALVVLAAALVLAVPLGGWERVDRADAAAELLEPGQAHASEPFATTVLGAELLDRAPGSSFDPEPGVRFLVVHARVDNRTQETRSAPADLLVLAGRDLGGPSVVLGRDPGSRADEVQPGLPDDVAYVWEVDDDSIATGDVLEVRVVDRTEVESQVGAGLVPIDLRVGAVVEVAVS